MLLLLLPGLTNDGGLLCFELCQQLLVASRVDVADQPGQTMTNTLADTSDGHCTTDRAAITVEGDRLSVYKPSQLSGCTDKTA